MRKTAFAAAVSFLLLLAIPAFAVQTRNVVDDVIKMTKSGVAEETILDFVQKAPRYDVNADDVVAMSEAGVSRNVVRAVVRNAENSSASSRDRVRDHETVVVAPSYGYYPSYGYWPYYDPWWYGPSLSLGFSFGGYYGGHYGGYYGGYHGGYHGGHGGHHR